MFIKIDNRFCFQTKKKNNMVIAKNNKKEAFEEI